MEYKTIDLSLNQLLIDPDNFRFLDEPNYRKIDPKRYHQASVQKKAEELLRGPREESIIPLKNSIRTNGYIPFELLFVKKYEHADDLYVVVEGNRRVAAMRWIVEDYEAGVDVPGPIMESFNKLPAVLIDPTNAENQRDTQIVMGIRHVSGTVPWGAYQQAKLVAELVDNAGMNIQEAAERIGMDSREAARRRRALRALVQMQENEEYGPYVRPELYVLFHEAVTWSATKDWLEWDDETLRFKNEENLRHFYDLVIGYVDENDHRIQPKVQTHQDVRDLRKILPKEEAKSILLDPSKSLADALAAAQRGEQSNWKIQVSAAISSLQTLRVADLKQMVEEEEKLLHQLKDLIESLMGDRQTLLRGTTDETGASSGS